MKPEEPASSFKLCPLFHMSASASINGLLSSYSAKSLCFCQLICIHMCAASFGIFLIVSRSRSLWLAGYVCLDLWG